MFEKLPSGYEALRQEIYNRNNYEGSCREHIHYLRVNLKTLQERAYDLDDTSKIEWQIDEVRENLFRQMDIYDRIIAEKRKSLEKDIAKCEDEIVELQGRLSSLKKKIERY